MHVVNKDLANFFLQNLEPLLPQAQTNIIYTVHATFISFARQT